MRKNYALALMGLFISCLANAQDSLKTTTLNEVVTSAVRSDQPIIETPRSVTVINHDVIEKSVYNSVGELLSKQSGNYIVGANQTPGTNQSLFMRGANSNQVVVLIDGSRITDPTAPNSTVDLAEISLTDIERIEIIRGSHSTLYGGSAIGGVVNIITKRGHKKGLHGIVSLQAGTFGKATSSLSQNIGLNYMTRNGVYFNGSLFNQNVNGLNASVDTLSKTNAYATADKDDFKKLDAYLKAGFKNSTWDVFASFKEISQHAEIDGGTYNDDDNAYINFDRNLVDYQVGYKLSDNWRMTALGSWSNSERRNVNDSSVNDAGGNYDATYIKGEYKGKIFTNELQFNYHYNKLKGVIGGGQYAEAMLFNTYYFNHSDFGNYISEVNYDTLDTSVKTNYVFGQANISLNNFNLSVGSRLSNHSIIGNYWTFEIDPSYKLDNLLLYASISSGFNPASLYQLYEPTKGFNAYTTRGNRNLKPEESLSFELGIKKEFTSESYITLSAYQTQTKNSIEYVYLWDKDKSISDLTYLENKGDTYLNIAKQVVSGLEIDGHVIYKKFYLTANISWLDGKITILPNNINVTDTGGNHVQLFNYGSFVTEEVTINKLVRRPRFTSNAEIGYSPLDNLSINAVYRYAGSRFDSGYDEKLGPYGALNQYKVNYYNLIDLGVNWQINKQLAISFKLENVLDETYQEILGYQTRGRSAYLKLNVRW